MIEFFKDQHLYSAILGDGDGYADATVLVGERGKFIPQIYTEKWSGEAWMAIRPKGVTIAGCSKETLLYDRVSAITGDMRHEYWVKNRGILEHSITLVAKPVSNAITFELEHSGNLEFLYQPRLTEQQIKEGHHQPDNAIGSYAVYLKGKRNNRYKTGKFCHLFRWRASDIWGNWVWCDPWVDLEAGLFHVMVPTSFLLSAGYPIVLMGAGDTFGYTSIGVNEYCPGFAYKAVQGYGVTAGSSGVAKKIYVYAKDVANEIKVCIYDALSGGDRLSLSYTIDSPSIDTWNFADVVGEELAIEEGNDYHNAFAFEASQYEVVYDAGEADDMGYKTGITYSEEMTNPCQVTTSSSSRMSHYTEFGPLNAMPMAQNTYARRRDET